MPKTDIDYSNTIIYKITCKDLEIKDVYVGHTTNFVQRKHAHKQCCNNDSKNDCKLYKIIKENGGWSNWKMEIVYFFNCNDHYEARQKEQEYFVSLNANLNSIEPMPKPKEKIIIVKPVKIKQLYICNVCNINCHTMKGLDAHNETNKHKKHLANKPFDISVDDDKHIGFSCVKRNPKNAVFKCDLCDFSCSKLSNWKIHTTTHKHKQVTKCDDLVPPKKTSSYTCCNCNKVYNSRNGLWVHSKKCNKVAENEPITDTSIILQLMKQNDEFKNIIIEQNRLFVGQSIDMQKQNSDLQKQILDVCKNSIIHYTQGSPPAGKSQGFCELEI